jgi:hypothetical protein
VGQLATAAAASASARPGWTPTTRAFRALRLADLQGPLEPLRGRLRLIQLVKLDQAEQLRATALAAPIC